jgi:hypothetical protein
MKHISLLVVCLIPLVAHAEPRLCDESGPQRADLLTPEQWQSVLNEEPNGDPVLVEAIAAEKARHDYLGAMETAEPIAIDWAQARKLVLLGVVRTTFQSHDLTVRLLTRSGRLYVTEEPRIDEIWRVAHIVDPCDVYIQHVTE